MSPTFGQSGTLVTRQRWRMWGGPGRQEGAYHPGGTMRVRPQCSSHTAGKHVDPGAILAVREHVRHLHVCTSFTAVLRLNQIVFFLLQVDDSNHKTTNIPTCATGTTSTCAGLLHTNRKQANPGTGSLHGLVLGQGSLPGINKTLLWVISDVHGSTDDTKTTQVLQPRRRCAGTMCK